MENSIKKSGGIEIPKRNRSLDLKSVCESKFSEARNSKKKVSAENDQGDVKNKKRKSRKEVPLSCFKSDAKKTRKENVNGVQSKLGSRPKSNERTDGLHNFSLALGNNGTSFNIPKRPRGSVGRKKVESDQGSERTRLPNSDDSGGTCKAEVTKSEGGVGPSDRLVPKVTISSQNDSIPKLKSAKKLNGLNSKLKEKSISKPKMISSSSNSKLKRKVGADEIKENRNNQPGSVHHVAKAYGRLVNNGDTLHKKQKSNSRKEKDLAVRREGGEASIRKSEPSGPVVGSSSEKLSIDFVDDYDDDEENLEQNAARMLSSRFDPSCTGFSSKRKSSVSEKAEGLSCQASSPRGSLTQQSKSFCGGQSVSADDKIRKLRPRGENKGKGVLRKRRHFYEIVAQDLDPHWYFNRRIKIFWPLDESWYYGLVNDFNSETKYHHIKYDDREEEWVNLQEEKFKLLLLPSEVPDKPKSRKRSTRNKDLNREQPHPSADDDSCIGDPLDSEPIASWLASQSQRFKALPKSLKRQRISKRHLSLVSSLSSEKTDNSNTDVVDSKVTRNSLDCECASADCLPFCGTGSDLLHGNTSTSQEDKHVVYFRKKYHKTSEVGSSLWRDAIACESSPWTVTPLATVNLSPPPTTGGQICYNFLNSDKQLWSFDNKGKLKLNSVLLESEEFKFQISLAALPPPGFSCEMAIFWMLHDIFMLQHGALMTTSPAVILEILLVDTNMGLRFLLFDGCLKQALAFVFQILTVLSESDEGWYGDMKIPMTSIRFHLSSFLDPRKQHVFAFYSFSRLKSSKWLYLDSKILQYCLLIKQLPVEECTYDNIKELQCGSLQLHKSHLGLELSSGQCVQKKTMPGILSLCVPQDACNTRTSQPAFCLAAKPGKVPPFALSFSAAPTFFLSLHLQILMEHSFAWVNLQHQDALCSSESSENGGQPDAECAQVVRSSVAILDGCLENDVQKLDTEASALSGLTSYKQDLGIDIFLATNAAENADSSEKIQEGNPETNGHSGYPKELIEIAPEVVNQPYQCGPTKEVHQPIDVSAPTPVLKTLIPLTSNPSNDSTSGGIIIEIPSSEQVDTPSDEKDCISRQTSDLICNVHDDFVHESNPIGSRSSWQHGGSNSISSSLGHLSPVWPDGMPNFTSSGFGNGPKKPRTQVQYTLPFVGHDLSEKPKMPSSVSLPCKRIRRASLKRISNGCGNDQKNAELLTCVANVLVTHGDKGWRECGAHIVLEVADHNEWRLAVKLSGITKYSYKVNHILQPGSTNRYSHAMMWKGGKDWILEFPDRSQWMIFKEMHEECSDRNIRAASVKNIPIPGVRLVEESDDYGTDAPFVRNAVKYFQQVQTDVEMAMDPSHILYDMDNDDEMWLMEHNNRTENPEEASEEFFEKAMNMFEKVSYSQLRDKFTDDEIGQLANGLGSSETAKVVYEYWRQKREKMGMPLLRHLQPPLWERYQQQLKEWEHNIARGKYALSVDSGEKVPPPEKPPMFAFCFKPRGLEVPNKGSKQRSHRKLPVSGHHHATSVDHDVLVYGRRSSGRILRDDKVLCTNSIYHDFSDISPSPRTSPKILSPRDAHFLLSSSVSDWKGSLKLYKSKKSKKLEPYPFFQNQQTSYNQRAIGKRSGVQKWPKLSGQRHYFVGRPHRKKAEQSDGSDLNEFRLHDASSAAQRASNTAKLKREKAQRLFYSADLAVHKAVSAIMTAEAIKDYYDNTKGITLNHQ